MLEHSISNKQQTYFLILPRELEIYNANRQVFWLVAENKRLPKTMSHSKADCDFTKG